MSKVLLKVRNLATEFATRAGTARAVDGVSFDVHAGEIVGLVGESGSGKSVTGYSILGLIDAPGRITGGSVRFDGQELIGMPHRQLRALRGRRIAMVFQDPMSTLNPVLTVSAQMQLAMRAHGQPDTAHMRARGFRVGSGMGAHAKTGRYALAVLDDPAVRPHVERFDDLRAVRNESEYDALLLDVADARDALVHAEAIVDAVERDLA